MGDAPPTGDRPGKRARAALVLRRHVLAFVVVGAAVFLINLPTAAWWLYWPVLAWGIAVAAHWLYVKSISVDDDWVEERTLEIRHGAYDLGHIEDIERRHRNAASPDDPAAERRDRPTGRE